MKRVNRWYRRHRFLTAYKIMRNEVERHRAAGHDMRFKAVNESYVVVDCMNCPDLLP